MLFISAEIPVKLLCVASTLFQSFSTVHKSRFQSIWLSYISLSEFHFTQKQLVFRQTWRPTCPRWSHCLDCGCFRRSEVCVVVAECRFDTEFVGKPKPTPGTGGRSCICVQRGLVLSPLIDSERCQTNAATESVSFTVTSSINQHKLPLTSSSVWLNQRLICSVGGKLCNPVNVVTIDPTVNRAECCCSVDRIH